MKKLEYCFYPPNKPQFYFPIKDFKSFSIYYEPYSILSRLFWYLFKNIAFLRKWFSLNEEKIPLPINTIKKILNVENSALLYNIGTEGPEQKATIIADDRLFMKFAQKKRAKELVKNEIKTLLRLKKSNTLQTANLNSYECKNEFAYLITDVISGKKQVATKINDEIFNCLINLAKIEVTLDSETKEIFSHGDFCPWNILIDSKTNKLVLIDWEMAEMKPLGYDLFTYIFQTNFLLNPKKNCNIIIEENLKYINNYFNLFQIKKWSRYLTTFAALKIKDEKSKENSLLLLKYNELLSSNGKN